MMRFMSDWKMAYCKSCPQDTIKKQSETIWKCRHRIQYTLRRFR